MWEFVWSGSQLTQMKKGSDTLHFTYDATGTPTTVTHNGTVYYYVTNLQGDVVKIIDSTGTTVATYTYDAWGNPTGTIPTTGIGYLNPLRYRSYIYDAETELYYLQSRYYNPEIGRFISADIFISTGQGFVGNNMFAYCGNNAVIYVDSTGYCFYNAKGEWCHDAWEYIGGHERMSDVGYGAASPYTPDASILYDCYPYAFGLKESRNVGEGLKEFDSSNLDEVASQVLLEAIADGRSVRPIDAYNSPIYRNEYRVALRTGENGYHFMKQHSDGTWSGKDGMCPSTLVKFNNPNAFDWDLPLIDHQKTMNTGMIHIYAYESNYYNSKTLYFAVSK